MKTRYFIAFITFASFVLRFIQSQPGYMPIMGDEWILERASLQMMATGGLNDLFLGYGDVLKIPYLLLDIFYYLFGLWKGFFNQVSTVMPFEGFVSVNRWENVFTGALALPVAYAIGKKLFNRQIGIVMALILFANPLQFSYSLYGKPDNTAFFFQLLSVLFALDIGSENDKNNRKGYILSGLFLALSIGSKVNFFLCALFPLVMHLFSPRDNLIKKVFSWDLAIFFIVLIGSYLLVTPTLWLSFPFYWSFWFGYFFQNLGPDLNFHLSHEILLELKDYLIRILGSSLIYYVGCIGLIGMLAERRKRVLALSGLILLLYLTFCIGSKNVLYYADPHHLFPLLPFAIIFAGSGVHLLCLSLDYLTNQNWRSVSVIVLTLCLIFTPLTNHIVNAEWSSVYLGGNSKNSFLDYLKTGKIVSEPQILIHLPVKEKEVLSKAIESSQSGLSSFKLKGLKENKMIAFLNKGFKNPSLNFQVKIHSRSNLIRSSIIVKVKPVQDLNGIYIPLHENSYTLLSRGIHNWREVDIPLENDIPLNRMTTVSLSIKSHLDEDGVDWNKVTYLLITFELLSPFETVDCEFKDIKLL